MNIAFSRGINPAVTKSAIREADSLQYEIPHNDEILRKYGILPETKSTVGTTDFVTQGFIPVAKRYQEIESAVGTPHFSLLKLFVLSRINRTYGTLACAYFLSAEKNHSPYRKYYD